MKWSRNDTWMVTADHDGYVKYWQANMNNVTMFQAHKEAVRSLRCCLSVDGIIKVVDAYDKIKSWALFYGFVVKTMLFFAANFFLISFVFRKFSQNFFTSIFELDLIKRKDEIFAVRQTKTQNKRK